MGFNRVFRYEEHVGYLLRGVSSGYRPQYVGLSLRRMLYALRVSRYLALHSRAEILLAAHHGRYGADHLHEVGRLEQYGVDVLVEHAP